MPSESTWRLVLSAQAKTAHAHKLARAAAVRRHIDLKAAEMWALVEQETADTAEAAWVADVEAKVMWAVYGNGRTEDVEDNDTF